MRPLWNYLIVLLWLVELSEQQTTHEGIEDTLLDIKHFILARLDDIDRKMEDKWQQFDEINTKLNKFDDINSKFQWIESKLDALYYIKDKVDLIEIGLDTIGDRSSSTLTSLKNPVIEIKQQGVELLDQISLMQHEVYHIKDKVDIIEVGLETIGERSSSTLIALKNPVMEIKQQGVELLDQIIMIKQERKTFNASMNILATNSEEMATKLVTMDHQLNSEMDNLIASHIKLATEMSEVKHLLNQSITSLKEPVYRIEKQIVELDKTFNNSVMMMVNETAKDMTLLTINSVDVKVSVGKELKLECGVIGLYHSCHWEHNEIIYQPSSKSINNQCGIVIPSVNKSHNGDWTCNVNTTEKTITRSKKIVIECSEGFIMIKGSKQCFKFYSDEKRSWSEAKVKCNEEGLLLPKPADAVAVALKKHLLDTYGPNTHVFLDARPNGTSKYMWERDWTELRRENPLWRPGDPGSRVTDVFCLLMLVEDRYPDQPYHSSGCHQKLYTLCEEGTLPAFKQAGQALASSKKIINECREGFITLKGSKQCFKYYSDEKRSWSEAKVKCNEEGLLLPKPADAVAVALKKHLLDTYGPSTHVFLDARPNGTSKYMWERDWTELRRDNPLWRPGDPGSRVTNVFCLLMLVEDRYPDQPYHSSGCHQKLYTLCEDV